MKNLKVNLFFAIVLTISITSCEKEESNQDQLSVEEEVSEFENRLKGSNSEEDTPDDNASDCSFDGVIEAAVPSGHYVGVNEHPNHFGSDTAVQWTVNGEIVNSLRPRFVRVNDHVSQAGPVEVCYSATSTDCGTISDCITIDFQG